MSCILLFWSAEFGTLACQTQYISARAVGCTLMLEFVVPREWMIGLLRVCVKPTTMPMCWDSPFWKDQSHSLIDIPALW